MLKYKNTQIPEFISKVKEEEFHLSTEILETQLNDDNKKVAVLIAVYIAHKLSK